MDPTVASGVKALRAGKALVDLSPWIRVLASGRDAAAFLGDLVSGDVAGLREGAATRSLLLTPTGRIRADFTVARLPEGYLLVQSPDQPNRIDDLLRPYVLSSEAELQEWADRGLAEVPAAAARGLGVAAFAPGPVGFGTAVVADPAALPTDLIPVGSEAVEAWRVLEGRARFPVDLGPDSIPAEADLDSAIDYTKGCFVGQESVAKVRNLGHPPFVVISATSDAPVESGAPVLAEGRAVGTVTSLAEDPGGGVALLARVRWDARDAVMRVGDAPLRRR